jgi:hypothetical protein
MVDLEDFEMADLEVAEGVDFEMFDMEGSEFESEMEFEGTEFEDFEALESFEDMESWGSSYEDLEADPFLGNIIKSASRAVSKVVPGISPQLLQNLAGQAARVAGGAIGGPTGAALAGQIANRVLREGEEEGWLESDPPYESGPIDPEILDELNYYAYQAAEAESEWEADPFIGALVGPLVNSFLSGETDLYEDFEGGLDPERDEFFPALLPLAMPLITKGIGAIGKMLAKNKSTRKFTRALPKILKESANEVQTLRRPPTNRDVARIVGRQTARTLGNPRAVAKTFRQNRVAAARAQSRPSSMRRLGTTRPRPMSTASTRRPGRQTYGTTTYAPTYVSGSYASADSRHLPIYSGRGRGRGRIVGYVLKPIYRSRR